MEVKQDIDGNDLYDLLWSQGKKNFEELVKNGVDEDDILRAIEEYFGANGDDIPTLTEVNDLLWFEIDYLKKEFLHLKDIEALEALETELRRNIKNWSKAVKDAIENDPENEDLYLAEETLLSIEDSIDQTLDDPDEKSDDLDSQISALTTADVTKSLTKWAEELDEWYQQYDW